jgi:release factor glutamine methyltransferase
MNAMEFITEAGGFPLETTDKVFKPTTTSRCLADLIDVQPGQHALDLGCGVGPLAIAMAMRGAERVVAIDVMEQACEIARRNVILNQVEDTVEVRCGDLFAPVRDEKFDVIVNDVSGMADPVARVSPWYPYPVPTGGTDGTEPTVRMLRNAAAHLKKGGKLYFPVISLASADIIIRVATECFGGNLDLLADKQIPFAPEFYDNIDFLASLRERGQISYTQRGSRFLWKLSIWRATVE